MTTSNSSISGAAIKDITQGSSWSEVFSLNKGGTKCPVGQQGYLAEFVLTDLNNPHFIIASANTHNGQAAWLADGVLRVGFYSAQTSMFCFNTAAFYLRITNPASCDPNGYSLVVLNGTIDLVTATGQQIMPRPVFPPGGINIPLPSSPRGFLDGNLEPTWNPFY